MHSCSCWFKMNTFHEGLQVYTILKCFTTYRYTIKLSTLSYQLLRITVSPDVYSLNIWSTQLNFVSDTLLATNPSLGAIMTIPGPLCAIWYLCLVFSRYFIWVTTCLLISGSDQRVRTLAVKHADWSLEIITIHTHKMPISKKTILDILVSILPTNNRHYFKNTVLREKKL